MLKSYLKIALRHISKNKGFSFLNILGLSLGLTCAVLILIWIQDEVSYNKFHKKYSVLYQVMENHDYDGKIYTFAATPGPMAAAVKQDMPEVVRSTRMAWNNRWLFGAGDKTVYENGTFVDPEFFKMFSFDFVEGSGETAISDEHSIVITEKMAKKFFGTSPAKGKYLKANDREEFVVSGVLKDPPVNSTLKFDWLTNFKNYEKDNDWCRTWTNNGLMTFVELKPLTALADFNRKFSGYLKSKESEASGEPFLTPMKNWRLRNNYESGKQVGGRIIYVRLFGIIAALLVIIGCINFMNLATARSEQRAKEVGVRKVMGAQRRSLFAQFMGESLVMAFLSMVMACLLTLLFLPEFNELVGKQLSFGYSNLTQWLLILVITLVCGLLAGSYPSVFLSSFKPVSIFRTMRERNSGSALVRKSLVVAQFVVSIVLMLSTVVVYLQIEYVRERNLGFNKDRLLYLNQTGKINDKLEVIEQDLLSTGVVKHVASCNQTVLNLGNNTGGFQWEGKNPDSDVLVSMEYISADYLNTTGMQLSSGRNLYRTRSDSMSILINETFADIIGGGDAVGKRITSDSLEYTIVGVVKDFVYNDMYRNPDPVIFFSDPKNTSYVFIRLDEKTNLEDAVAKVGDVFKKHNAGYPFEYQFLDADFDNQFRSEMLISKLSRLFSIITIIISCLGVFGLAAYTAERRTKEIGIRKVLGATVRAVVGLLTKDFVKLVLVAIVIAVPLGWYIMSQWLQDYAYRISIQWWMFVLAALLALGIALITVSFQAIKAAIANPVKSLRTE